MQQRVELRRGQQRLHAGLRSGIGTIGSAHMLAEVKFIHERFLIAVTSGRRPDRQSRRMRVHCMLQYEVVRLRHISHHDVAAQMSWQRRQRSTARKQG